MNNTHLNVVHAICLWDVKTRYIAHWVPTRQRRISSCVERCGRVGHCGVGPLWGIWDLCAGQTSCGSWPFALKHLSIGVTYITDSGDCGRLVKVHLLRFRLLISSHGEIVIVWHYKYKKDVLGIGSKGKKKDYGGDVRASAIPWDGIVSSEQQGVFVCVL